jgi:hypothetical protein
MTKGVRVSETDTAIKGLGVRAARLTDDDQPTWNGKPYVPEDWVHSADHAGAEHFVTGERMPYEAAYRLLIESERGLSAERQARIAAHRNAIGRARSFDAIQPLITTAWRMVYGVEQQGVKDFTEIIDDLRKHSAECPHSKLPTWEGVPE